MTTPEGSALPDAAGETLHAARNTLKLGSSLLGTWGIALAMRFVLPRYLGPERYGALSFADAFVATLFVALGLGADFYVRKRVSLEPGHASDFFGGMCALRFIMSAGVTALAAVMLALMHRPLEVRYAVYLFSVAQLFVTANSTLSAMLHAKGAVGAMSILAVATKVVWALGVLIALRAGAGLWGFAAAYLLSEAIETAVLFRLAGRHLGLVFRIDAPATRAMVVFSLPYYVNAIATTAYGKLDLSVLALVGGSVEVGFYAAASAIAGLSLLVTPLIGWVLIPTLARAASRSSDELHTRIQRSTELILTVTIPVALLLALGADMGVRLLFGDAFAPATLALRILAPTFVVTYLAMVYAITLAMLERPWTLTAISVMGLGVNVLFNVLLIRRSITVFGKGGGGAGCAIAMLVTEVFVTTSMASIVGRRAIGRRTLATVGKAFGACGIVIGVDHFAAPLGWSRLVLDAALYLLVVVATGSLRLGEITGILRDAIQGRAGVSQPDGSA